MLLFSPALTDMKEQVHLPQTPFEVLCTFENIENVNIIETLKGSLNSASIKTLAELTVRQAKCKLWQKHRKGRITGSKMHSVFTLKDSTSRDNIVKSILGLSPDIKTPAMLYVLKMKKLQGKHIFKYQNEFHENFKCELTGVILNECYPHLGSSPDGIVNCSCCGKGCLEIKCLAKYENGLPGPFLPDDPESCDEVHSPLKMHHTLLTKISS